MSKKRASRIPERKGAMVIVRVRDDNECQFWNFIARCTNPRAVTIGIRAPDCHGPKNGHELRKSSHYPEDYYDPKWIVLLCNGHNDWVDDHNDDAVLIGLRVETSAEL